MTNPYYTPGTFAAHTTARAAAIQAELNKVQTAFDDLNTALNNFGQATSTSTITVGTGTKSLVITDGHFIQVGQNIVMSDATDPVTNYMIGVVTAYSSTTGATTVEVSESGGSGSLSNWAIAITVLGSATRIAEYPGAVLLATIKAGMDLDTITNALFAAKAPLASPDLTGTPTGPTASKATDSTQLATTAFVQDNTEWTTIATATGGTGISTITFASIPTHYKDLMLVGDTLQTDTSSSAFQIGISEDGANWSDLTIGTLNTTSGFAAFVFLNAQANAGPAYGGFITPYNASRYLISGVATIPNLWVANGGIDSLRLKAASPRIFTAGSNFKLLGR